MAIRIMIIIMAIMDKIIKIKTQENITSCVSLSGLYEINQL